MWSFPRDIIIFLRYLCSKIYNYYDIFQYVGRIVGNKTGTITKVVIPCYWTFLSDFFAGSAILIIVDVASSMYAFVNVSNG